MPQLGRLLTLRLVRGWGLQTHEAPQTPEGPWCWSHPWRRGRSHVAHAELFNSTQTDAGKRNRQTPAFNAFYPYNALVLWGHVERWMRSCQAFGKRAQPCMRAAVKKNPVLLGHSCPHWFGDLGRSAPPVQTAHFLGLYAAAHAVQTWRRPPGDEKERWSGKQREKWRAHRSPK